MVIGEKCIVSAMTEQDIDCTIKWVNDPEYRYWNGTVFPISDIEHKEFIRNKIKSRHNKIFSIKMKDNMDTIGFVGIKNTDLINSKCEIFGSIGREETDYINERTESKYISKGLGSEAFFLISEFCLNELNLHKVYSKVYSYNQRSLNAFA